MTPILVFALALSLSPADSPEPRGSVPITISPVSRICIAPCYVRFTARAREASDSALWCAGTAWIWGDGTSSLRDQSCPPYEPGDHSERAWESAPLHQYPQPGMYYPRFELWKDGKRIGWDQAQVEVLDPR